MAQKEFKSLYRLTKKQQDSIAYQVLTSSVEFRHDGNGTGKDESEEDYEHEDCTENDT